MEGSYRGLLKKKRKTVRKWQGFEIIKDSEEFDGFMNTTLFSNPLKRRKFEEMIDDSFHCHSLVFWGKFQDHCDMDITNYSVLRWEKIRKRCSTYLTSFPIISRVIFSCIPLESFTANSTDSNIHTSRTTYYRRRQEGQYHLLQIILNIKIFSFIN